MPKLLTLSGRALCKILASNGFEKVRQKGSHIVMRNASMHKTIPIPDHKELDKGTLSGIIRQSGLPRSLFEA